jgi:hypothetical protein
MADTDTTEEIKKMARKGLSIEAIAREIGRPGPLGEDRVRRVLGLPSRLRLDQPKRGS